MVAALLSGCQMKPAEHPPVCEIECAECVDLSVDCRVPKHSSGPKGVIVLPVVI